MIIQEIFNLISRITTTQKNGEKICLFDFKNKTIGNDKFKVAKESLPMRLEYDQIEIAKSMLEVLGFEQSADNLRTRYVYLKDGVEFEIDQYTRPQMNVIGIEGEKDKVDKIYQHIINDREFKEIILT